MARAPNRHAVFITMKAQIIYLVTHTPPTVISMKVLSEQMPSWGSANSPQYVIKNRGLYPTGKHVPGVTLRLLLCAGVKKTFS